MENRTQRGAARLEASVGARRRRLVDVLRRLCGDADRVSVARSVFFVPKRLASATHRSPERRPMMAETPCCRGGLRTLIASKLGRCPRCIRASAFGTLAGWIAAALVSVAWPTPILLGLSFLLAIGFSTLLVAHLLAFLARLWALRDTMATRDPKTSRRGSALVVDSRRFACCAQALPCSWGRCSGSGCLVHPARQVPGVRATIGFTTR
jgi:hypothetical protein